MKPEAKGGNLSLRDTNAYPRDDAGNVPVRGGLALVPAAPSLGVYARGPKRAVDVVVALVGLILTSPIILLAAICVRVTMGRPVLFRQRRVGREGVVFEVLKFRSMHQCRRVATLEWAGRERREAHKSTNDPRHTRFGRLLRSTSIDELPQLLNVIRGDMSIVGPRPELVAIALRDGLDRHPRIIVRPGITGLWQLNAPRDETIASNVSWDEEYLKRVSLGTDLAIILRTPIAMVSRRGS